MSIAVIRDYVKLITPGVSENRSEYFSIASINTNQTNSILWLFAASISYSKKTSKDSTETTDDTKGKQNTLWVSVSIFAIS